MAGYRSRLQRDLDRWIDQGLVPAASRQPILDQASSAQRIDAAGALAAVGGLLLGVAVIAFVAANWSVIPRIGRFGLILALFLAVSGGAAWAHARPLARNIALLVAALVYAAAIGLTGQIFDIAGDPVDALHMAGLAAGLLALAGRSSAAGIAAVALIGFGDFAGLDDRTFPWLTLVAPAALALAWRLGSKPVAHAAGLALPATVGLLMAWMRIEEPVGPMLGTAMAFAGLVYVCRRGDQDSVAGVVFGWAVWSSLAFLAFAGLGGPEGTPLPVRGLWLLCSAGVVALGLHDRRPMTTAAGVVGVGAAMAAILLDLGLGLLAASAVFALVAVLALAGGWGVRRRSRT